MTYPSSHDSTGLNACHAAFRSSFVSNRSISTSPFMRSVTISSDESSFTFSFSPDRFNKGEKRGHPQTSPDENQNQNQNQNQKPTKKSTKLMPFTAGIPSISFPPLSPEQYLQKALKSLTQAYKGLEEEEEKKKEQVKQLQDYTRSILAGENPFIKGKEKQEKDVLKGLVEEVRALCKEVAPIRETYTERLKKDLSSSSPSSRVTSNTSSSTSTRSK